MQPPVFEFVPVLGASTAAVKVAKLAALSTRHDDPGTDRGRLYGSVTLAGSVYTLGLYADPAHATLVSQGTASAIGQLFTLTPPAGGRVTGSARIESYDADDVGLVLLPTFAVDEDVLLSAGSCASLPGYDADYGLAYLHAKAMRRILCSDLPAAVPYLYGGAGLAALVPVLGTSDLPDLTKLANADQLREAQADLVKALSAKQQEHLEEFAKLAAVAMEAYRATMAELASSNTREPDATVVEQATSQGISFGTWQRG